MKFRDAFVTPVGEASFTGQLRRRYRRFRFLSGSALFIAASQAITGESYGQSLPSHHRTNRRQRLFAVRITAGSASVDVWRISLSSFRVLHQSIHCVADLFQWYDLPFVELAYPIMLRRPADPEGTRYYLARLRDGHSRTAILHQLWKSGEADPMWGQVRDLRAKLDRFRRSRHPILGLWLRWAAPDISSRRAMRRERAMDNALGRIRQEMLEASETSQAAQDRLRITVDRLGDQLNILISAGASSSMTATASGGGVPPPYQPSLRSVYGVREMDMPDVGRRVFNTLKI